MDVRGGRPAAVPAERKPAAVPRRTAGLHRIVSADRDPHDQRRRDYDPGRTPRRIPELMPGPRPVPAIAAGSWRAAGGRFIKRVIVPPIPISRYTGKISGVPLTGGQAQGAMSGAGALTLSVG